MSTNDDRLYPSRNRFGNPGKNNGLTEHSTTKDIADLFDSRIRQANPRIITSCTYGTVRAPPHLLEMELFHPFFVRRNGCAFDTDLMFEDGICRIYSNLVICL